MKGIAMELTEHRCQRCGAELDRISEDSWKCKYCGCTYDDTAARKNAKRMQDLFDEAKREKINNLRRMLYDATTAEYISSTDVKNACVELKKYLPSDFRANFYETAVDHNEKKLTAAIRKIDVEANFDEIENIVRFLIKSLQPEFLLELNNLVERAYKQRDLQTFERFSTEISIQAEKVEQGVYETKLPREVFVAYSSKDMEKVSELVEVLESQGIKCFVAARNLRHGKGAVENYDKALKEAMDHCKSFVFVSSLNSRSLSCDALEIEIPYIQNRDIENAPPEYRNNYTAIPHKYKKPRVEYRIESSKGFNAADQITGEFFDGYEWVLSPDEVAVRILKQLVATPGVSEEPKADIKPGKKYCVNCGRETPRTQTYCAGCGKTEFVNDITDYIRIKNQRDIEERLRRERAAVSARASTPPPSASPNNNSNKKKKKKSKAPLIILSLTAVFIIVIAILSGNSSSNPDVNNQWPVSTGDGYIIGIQTWQPGAPAQTEEHYPWETEDGRTDHETDHGNGEYVYETWYGSVKFALTADGTLIVSGEGNVPSYSNMGWHRPWESYATVYEIIIEDGITGIGDEIFANSAYLESVTLASSVEWIGANAFSGSSLSSIEAPGVTKIGSNAFQSCGALTEVTFDNVTEIESYAFYGCSALRKVSLPKAVRIANEAFRSTAIEEISVGDSIEEIGSEIFAETPLYSNLSVGTPLYIGNVLIRASSESGGFFEVRPGTTVIAEYALAGCSKIEGIIIPLEVKHIGNYAFADMNNVRDMVYVGTAEQWDEITFGDSWNANLGSDYGYEHTFLDGNYDPTQNDEYTPGLQLNIDFSKGECYVIGFVPGDDTDLSEPVKIPSKYYGYPVTEIKSGAFGDKSITGVQIPASVKRIESEAFLNCDQLVSVEIAEDSQLEHIGNSVFGDCDALAYTNNALYVGTCLVDVQGDFKGVFEIRPGTTLIADWAFYGCTNIEGIIIPAEVKHIGNYAFADMYYVRDLVYVGTEEQWDEISFGDGWNNNTGYSEVCFLNGNYDPTQSDEYTPGLEFKRNFATGECYVTGFVPGEDFDWTTTIEIPSIYLGYPVTKINNGAFGEKSITGVHIPASVKVIEEAAFYDCNQLVSVYIAEDSQLETIGSSAFCGCDMLSEFNIPAGVTSIGESAFRECPALESLVFADGIQITEIPTYMAYESGLTSITIPATVTVIRANAFAENEALASVEFPEDSQLDSIESDAFNNCKLLTSVALPVTLTEMSDYAFNNCPVEYLAVPAGVNVNIQTWNGHWTSLKTLVINGGETFRADAYGGKSGVETIIIGDTVKTIEANALSSWSSLKSITVGTGVETVGDGAFSSNSALESVTFNGTSIKSMGYGTFQGCGALISLIIPEGVETLGENAFYNCDMLSSVVLPETLTSIGKQAFYSCESLVSVTFNGTLVTTIEDETFRGCTSLKSITIPEGVESLGVEVFRGCEALSEVILPDSLTSIGEYTFCECDSLNTLVLPNIDTINQHLFYNSGLTSIVIPDSVTSIQSYAFGYCESLEEVVLPGMINKDSIDDYAFYNANNIKRATLSTEVISKLGHSKSNFEEITLNGGTRIYPYTFSDCQKLSKVTLHDGLEQINLQAFYGCISLMTIEIPESVESCDKTAFEGCIKLVEVIDKSQSRVASKVENCLYAGTETSIIDYMDDFAFITCDSGTYLIGYVGESKDITIPAEYNGAGYKLFKNAFINSDITSIVVQGIDDIVDYAFNNCTSLTSVIVGESVTRVGVDAFRNCSSLESVEIGDNVLTIEEGTFAGCSELANVSLGASVQKIGAQAFMSCSSLGRLLIPASVEEIGRGAFQYCSLLGSLKFEDPTEFRFVNGEYDSGNTDIDLGDPAQNVDYFTSNYLDYICKKNSEY